MALHPCDHLARAAASEVAVARVAGAAAADLAVAAETEDVAGPAVAAAEVRTPQQTSAQ